MTAMSMLKFSKRSDLLIIALTTVIIFISNPNKKSNHRHMQVFSHSRWLLLYIDMVNQGLGSMTGQIVEGFHIGGKLFLVFYIQIVGIGVGLVVQNEPLLTDAIYHVHNAVPDLVAGFAAERHFAIDLVSRQQCRKKDQIFFHTVWVPLSEVEFYASVSSVSSDSSASSASSAAAFLAASSAAFLIASSNKIKFSSVLP